MANPWDSDPIVGGNPWDADPVVSKPQAKAKPKPTSPTRPNFGNVRSGSSTTENQQYPLLSGDFSFSGPTLEQINAQNRARQNSGAAQEIQAKIDAQRKAEYRQLPAPLRALIGVGEVVDKNFVGLGQLGAIASDYANPSGGASARMQAIEQRRRRTNAPMQGDLATGVGNFVGDTALLAVPMSKVGALSALPRYTSAIGLSGAYGAAQPVIDGESRGANAAISGAAGGLGQAFGDVVGAMGRRAATAIDPIKRTAIETAQRFNIPLHAAQVSDSVPAKTIASMGKYLPFSGAHKAAARQQEALNRAIGSTFGADAPKLSDQVMANARKTLSQRFEEIYSRNNINMSPDAVRKLVSVETESAKRLTRDEAQVVRNQLDDILKEAQDSGVLTGQKYQALRTQIMKAEGPDRVGNGVAAIRKALDQIAAEAVGPQDAAALRQLRGQWANLRTTEGLLKQVAGAGGDVKPSSIWPAIRNGSTQDMRDLGRMGQLLLKDPIPDSGTAGRTLMSNAFNPLAWPLLVPAVGGGATIGRAANSPAIAAFLARPGAGQTRQALAKLLGPAATVAGKQVNDHTKKRP